MKLNFHAPIGAFVHIIYNTCSIYEKYGITLSTEERIVEHPVNLDFIHPNKFYLMHLEIIVRTIYSYVYVQSDCENITIV